jgi:breast carcinoma-amplified sequence 3
MIDTTKYGTRVTPDTPLALRASPKAQWPLQRYLDPLLNALTDDVVRLFRLSTWPEARMSVGYSFLSQGHRVNPMHKVQSKDDWVRQVEMNTHAGPHRRLWMGPQFQFKHYSEATVSVCHPNSNVFTADSPQTSMNIFDADLKSLP